MSPSPSADVVNKVTERFQWRRFCGGPDPSLSGGVGVQMCTDPHTVRKCGGPGVLTPSLSGGVGVQVYTDPLTLSTCIAELYLLYGMSRHSIVSVLPTAAELCMHADFCISVHPATLNINVDFIRLFDWINCIKMFGSGWAGSAQTPWGVHKREGKKVGLKGGEKWPRAWTPPVFMTDRRHWTFYYYDYYVWCCWCSLCY